MGKFFKRLLLVGKLVFGVAFIVALTLAAVSVFSPSSKSKASAATVCVDNEECVPVPIDQTEEEIPVNNDQPTEKDPSSPNTDPDPQPSIPQVLGASTFAGK